MDSRIAILLLFAMVACVGTRVGAQQTMPLTADHRRPR
jgi:hypothetical protein